MDICVVGLGYVGLPLAVRLAEFYKVIGFEINPERVEELKACKDSTNEVTPEELKGMEFTTDPAVIRDCGMVIVTVPTPIDDAKNPDLGPLLSASETVGRNLKKGTVVVYESTVYPGCTENDCVPILEKESGLAYGKDFTVGYSPERMNPGDKVHTVDKITKVVSGSDPDTLDKVSEVYSKVTKIHRASSIKVAEGSKIIENTQRDINIALMNELKMIFDRMGINTDEVLEAACTKWNFLPFSPGLVGGHCIGVDPYYLAYEANRLGHHPEMILAGRRINDSMAQYEAMRILRHMVTKDIKVKGARVLVLGGTFKPDVPDTRNSKVACLIKELRSFGCSVWIHEPWIAKERLFGVPNAGYSEDFDLIVKAVRHEKFSDLKYDYEVLQ